MIKTILSIIKQIPIDKFKHFFIGSLIASFALMFSISPLYSLSLVALIAFLKELKDLFGQGTPEVLDFIWTVAGGLVVITPQLFTISNLISSLGYF